MLISSAWDAIASRFDIAAKHNFSTCEKSALLKATSPIAHAKESGRCKGQVVQHAHDSCRRSGPKPGSRLADYFQAERQLNDWYRFHSQNPNNL